MAESDRAQFAGRGFKINIPSAHFFLLGVSRPESHEANDTDADDRSLPNPLSQVFTPFPFCINSVATVGHNYFDKNSLSFGRKFRQEEISAFPDERG
jgi:hypothetical protein